MSELDLDAIEARAKAATPGPWRPSATKPPAADSLKVWAPNPDGPAGFCDEKCVLVGNKYFAEQAEKDVAFAAHAREDIPALIAELRRLREENVGRDGWIPVEERLPEDNVDILMWNDILAEIGHYSLKSRSFVTHGYCTQFATHWQPLPNRPKVK